MEPQNNEQPSWWPATGQPSPNHDEWEIDTLLELPDTKCWEPSADADISAREHVESVSYLNRRSHGFSFASGNGFPPWGDGRPSRPGQRGFGRIPTQILRQSAQSQGRGSSPQQLSRMGQKAASIYDCSLVASDAGVAQTRYLYLHPGQPGDPISCSLKTSAVARSTVYKALSYHWGSGPTEKTISVGNMTVSVSQTLLEFLSNFRDEKEDRVLWIDAICINQADNEEKEYQVSIMDEIYKSAESVVIWLGEASESSHLAFQLLSRLANLWPKVPPAPDPTSYPDLSSSISKMELPSEAEWAALGDLWIRPYWTRVWVIQELSFANMSSVFMCGSDLLSVADVAMAETALYQCRTNLPGFALHKAIQYVPDLLWLSREARSKSFRMDLQDILELSVLFSASDPRDRIFALLGIADTRSGAHTLEAIYSPAYSLSAASIDACHYLLVSCKTLDFLCRHRLKRPLQDGGSWLPNYSCVGSGPPGPYTHARTYNACSRAQPEAWISEDSKILKADGFVIDTVVTVQGPFAGVSSSSLCDTLKEIKKTILQNLTSEIRLKDVSASSQAPEPEGERVIDIMSEALGLRDADRAEWKTDYVRYMESENEQKKGSVDVPFFVQRTLASIKDCCFFSTAERRFGIGATGIETGDLVCTLYGSSMCQVLRELREEIYHRHIGAAVVTGCMDGEVQGVMQLFLII